MNPLDWFLALSLAYSVVRATLRGFVSEAFALAGGVLGFLFACWFYRSAAVHLTGLISSPQFAQFAAFLLILLVTAVAATLLGKLLRRTASVIGLGFFDRLFGALFGLIRGAILGVAFLLAVTAFLPTAPWLTTSLLAPYFLSAAHAVSFIMPSDLKVRLYDGLDRIKHTAPGWIKSGLMPHTQSDSSNKQ